MLPLINFKYPTRCEERYKMSKSNRAVCLPLQACVIYTYTIIHVCYLHYLHCVLIQLTVVSTGWGWGGCGNREGYARTGSHGQDFF